MKFLKLSAVAGLMMLLAAPALPAETPPPGALNDAYAFLFTHYNPGQAIPRLQKLAQRYPDWEEPYLLLSYVFRRERNFTEAETVAGMYLKRHPGSPALLSELALSYLESGKPERFPEVWERIAPESRGKAEFRYLHALYLFRVGKYGEAASGFSFARDNATNPGIAVPAGIAYVDACIKEGKTTEAAEGVRRVREGRELSVRDRMTLLSLMEGIKGKGVEQRKGLAMELEAEGPNVEYEGLLARAFLAEDDLPRSAFHALLDLEGSGSPEKRVFLAEVLIRGNSNAAGRYLEDLPADGLTGEVRQRADRARIVASAMEAAGGGDSKGGARIGLPESPVSFGTARKGHPAEVVLTVENRGDRDLLIFRVAPTVPWISGMIGQRTVPPGTASTVTARVEPGGAPGERGADLYIFSSDLSAPRVTVRLTGRYED